MVVLLFFLYINYKSFAYLGINMGPCKWCHTFRGQHIHYTSPGTFINSSNYVNNHKMCKICKTYPGKKHIHSF